MDYQKQLDKLLELTCDKKASDLHISCGHPPILRIDTKLTDVEGEEVVTPEMAEGLAFVLMTEAEKEKFLKERDIDLAYEFGGRARFRANIFFQSKKISIAMRLIPQGIRNMEELGLPPIMHYFVQAKQGFVLITGATSQGKSTTLAAIIDEINQIRREHIITIEHPIEYVFEDNQCIIDQREVYQDSRSFPEALRAALREDPNVIMVGELRDFETISTAITAAETGHLVFGTLHTSSAAKTVDRIIDAFPAGQQAQIRTMLSESLKGVLCQQLLKRIDKPGRLAALEILFCKTSIANLIREAKTFQIPSMIQTGKGEGMQLLDQAIMDFLMKKQISPEEAYLKANDKNAFERFIKKT